MITKVEASKYFALFLQKSVTLWSRVRKYWGDLLRNVPENTKISVGIGLAAGTIILMVLTLFPGEPFDYNFEDGNAEKLADFKSDYDAVHNPGKLKKAAAKAQKGKAKQESAAEGSDEWLVDSGTTDKQAGAGSAGLRRRKKKGEAAPAPTKDDAPPEDSAAVVASEPPPPQEEKFVFDEAKWIAKAAKAEKVLGIPQEDFKKAILNAKREFEESEASGESKRVVVTADEGSGLKMLENFILFGMIAAGCYFVNRDYGGALGTALIRFFPREAHALGYFEAGTQSIPLDATGGVNMRSSFGAVR